MWKLFQGSSQGDTPLREVVAKSLKALNHEGHEEHKGKEKLFFFVFFVSFVVPFL